MPETNEDRELAASIIDIGAGVVDGIGAVLGATPAGLAVSAGAKLVSLISRLVRSVGTQDATELVEDLVARKSEGVISDDDLTADDAGVMSDIASWYASDDGEHPPDDPDTEDS